MLEDWRNVDLNSITKQTLYTMEDTRDEHRKLIIQCKTRKDVVMGWLEPTGTFWVLAGSQSLRVSGVISCYTSGN